MMGKYFFLALLIFSGCSTNYDLPVVSKEALADAEARLNFHQNIVLAEPVTAEVAVRNFTDVIQRVEPVAEAVCATQVREDRPLNCDYNIVFDDDATAPANAFQTIGRDGRPLIIFNIAFIAEARNQDEIAFVMGHEAGHYIAEHLKKQKQQQVAGALIMGTLTAVSQAYATSANPYRSTAYDQVELRNSIDAGVGVGSVAFSQTYELEADYLGALIAKQAGYDPERGALLFARRENPKNVDGSLSFWGTHPPSAQRLATVIETIGQFGQETEK